MLKKSNKSKKKVKKLKKSNKSKKKVRKSKKKVRESKKHDYSIEEEDIIVPATEDIHKKIRESLETKMKELEDKKYIKCFEIIRSLNNTEYNNRLEFYIKNNNIDSILQLCEEIQYIKCLQFINSLHNKEYDKQLEKLLKNTDNKKAILELCKQIKKSRVHSSIIKNRSKDIITPKRDSKYYGRGGRGAPMFKR